MGVGEGVILVWGCFFCHVHGSTPSLIYLVLPLGWSVCSWLREPFLYARTKAKGSESEKETRG